MLKSLLTAATLTVLLSAPAWAADCNKMADDKKLAGAARTSFVKKCERDHAPAVSAACTKSADDKKLAGAARTSHLKKCMADEAAKKP
jgi:hypothetical protein